MTIGEISDILTWGAVSAYTVAMIAFAIDLAAVTERIAKNRTTGQKEKVVTVAKTKALGIAMSTTLLGALLHAGAVITR